MSVTDAARIRVLSVDDHPLLREGIAAIINNQADMLLVAEASNGTEALQIVSPASARHNFNGSSPSRHQRH